MPNFRNRLSPARRRVYDRSDAVTSVPLRATPRLRAAVAALPATLEEGGVEAVRRLSQLIVDEITTALGVPPVRVIVSGVRPRNARGELHGLYVPATHPAAEGGPARITVWMVTARRRQVVAFRTFLRTLLHEVCHHLDYALLRLPESFHSTGFYQRESSLFYRVGGDTAQAQGPAPASRGAARPARAPGPSRPG